METKIEKCKCGKEIDLTFTSNYAWKLIKNNKVNYYCSYSHYIQDFRIRFKEDRFKTRKEQIGWIN